MSEIKFKNGDLKEIIDFLKPENIRSDNFKISRAQTKFVKILANHYQEWENELMEFRKSYLPKDENGKYIWAKDEDGNVLEGQFNPYTQLDPETLNEFQEKFIQLHLEEVIIDKLDSTVPILNGVKKLLENPDFINLKETKFSFIYDHLCEVFEVELNFDE
jgi:hypothetical protein